MNNDKFDKSHGKNKKPRKRLTKTIHIVIFCRSFDIMYCHESSWILTHVLGPLLTLGWMSDIHLKDSCELLNLFVPSHPGR